MKIILASASPRRQELLKNIFTNFDIETSSCEENAVFSTPEKYVKDLASLKALDIASKHEHDSSPSESLLIIGADTIVYHNGKILGKPSDKEDAKEMLSALSGNIHQVYTGICIVYINKGHRNIFTDHECTKVIVDCLSEAEIEQYILSKDPFDKAGSYGIQGQFSKHIKGIEGDYFNVVGLPIYRLYQMLRKEQLI